ncbi:hydantoinase/carbamoylase family amidase [Bordetella sp. FB-8]|uniref:hydantoinase/carbamoylase family amidase n=1 Tax=Bordetella sp. FB-8 TaxID=1159870 RepID=UPI000375C91F|nr:hydantoinase/carbamoylase family amidase [Bordetella sp. FB-8]
MPDPTVLSATALGPVILAQAHELAKHSDDSDGLTCAYMTAAHRKVAAQLALWMRQAGFDAVRVDEAGNVVGRYRACPRVQAPPLVAAGSHYDTVRNGGLYDGRLGILLPMALVAQWHARHWRPDFDFEVVGFAEEEGVRFGSTFLGSSAYIGRFDAAMLAAHDGLGISMAQALNDAGHDPRALAAAGAGARPDHYFEVHIEQGPVLLARGLAVGVVSAIAGATRRRFTLQGRAGHAGTTPMDMRRDAACAAAEIVLAIEARCRAHPELVGTVGKIEVPGGSINVVPGRCAFTLDLRAPVDALRDAALADILSAAGEICARRGIELESETLMGVPATPCDQHARALWREAIAAQGLEVCELPSGAGHDAIKMAEVAPVSMLFVRCGNGGISHHPDETVSAADIDTAAVVTQAFLSRLA